MRAGGKAKRTLLEMQAENTGQNAALTYELIKRNNLQIPRSIEIVTKPYMERRALATFEAQWPGDQAQSSVTSLRIPFAEHAHSKQRLEAIVCITVGDFEHLIEYPKRGFQSERTASSYMFEAWTRLVRLGYTQHPIHK